jgi:uncharacterized membrane protein YbhN (UPF0104 family)
MDEVFHAAGVFFHHLRAVDWKWLGIAVACHVAKLVCVSRGWRNAIAAAYPDTRVSWPRMFGAYVAGTGVNAVLPARSGDAVKLYIAKHRVEGSTYPTLGATIVLMTLFDMVIAGCLAAWAIAIGVLPALKLLPHLPSLDFRWFFAHPRIGGAIVLGVLLTLLAALIWGARRVEEFWRRVRQGFAVLQTPARYLRTVVFWQMADWALRLATVFFMLRAFGLPATVHNALLVQVSQSLASIFPLTPNGIGTEQGLLLYVFRGKATRPVLLSFSVGMRITLTIVNAVLGFTAILLMLRTLRIRRIVAREPATQDAGSPR